METAIILIQCPDTKGIIATISQWVSDHKGNIIRSDQYSTDEQQGRFFMRLEFCFDHKKTSRNDLEKSFATLAKQFSADWSIHYKDKKPRIAILVSQHDHCLHDLLYHWNSGDLHADIACIISNHETCRGLAQHHDIPFHYLPVTKETKTQQENEIMNLTKDHSDFMVLARYMQILSDDFIKSYDNAIINIHHSFLPSFVGAKPYQQAYERGVKVIGATAHYVTKELDEGPIIEQMVEPVSHRDTVALLKRKGKNLEKLALLRAIIAHCQHRVIRYGNKTIVFGE